MPWLFSVFPRTLRYVIMWPNKKCWWLSVARLFFRSDVGRLTCLLLVSQDKLGNGERFFSGSGDPERLLQINCQPRERKMPSCLDYPAVEGAFLERLMAEAFSISQAKMFLSVSLPSAIDSNYHYIHHPQRLVRPWCENITRHAIWPSNQMIKPREPEWTNQREAKCYI